VTSDSVTYVASGRQFMLGALLCGVLTILLLVVAVVWARSSPFFIVLLALVVGGVVLTVISLRPALTPPRLTVDAGGIRVSGRGATVNFPWADVDRVWIERSGLAVEGMHDGWLLVSMAPGAARPEERNTLNEWRPDFNAFLLPGLSFFPQSAEEIGAGIRRYAGDRWSESPASP
jgi:hypothetical protein